MKKKYILLLIMFLALPVFSQSRSTVLIDTPTAYTIGQGTYKVSSLLYENGGLELKTVIGLHDIIYLGISVDFQNLIGKENPRPNIPGVIAKIKFTDGKPPFLPAIAIGYDSFYSGIPGKTINRANELDRMIYGPYLALTSPVYLFDEEQFVSYGIRIPTQPYFEGDDTSYFLGFDVPIGESFRIKTEVERVYWNFDRFSHWLLNFGIRYTYMEQLGVEFDLILQKNQNPNRVIRIEYINNF